jgi:hypothetical protein
MESNKECTYIQRHRQKTMDGQIKNHKNKRRKSKNTMTNMYILLYILPLISSQVFLYRLTTVQNSTQPKFNKMK